MMQYTVTLTLPAETYQAAAQRAIETNRTIEQVLAEQLQNTLSPFPSIHVSPHRAAMLREAEAYEALHSQLVMQFLGQYVAIYNGEVVDHDEDEESLVQRRHRDYSDEVVLIRRVEAEPARDLIVRSPRFVNTQ